MVEKEKQYREKVKYGGIFDFKDAYTFLSNWFIDEDYVLEEEKYTEKVGESGKYVEVKWNAWKKISDYFKFEIKVKWEIFNMTTVEIEKGGKKIKLNKGGNEVDFKGYLVRDWENKWETTPWKKFMRSVYDRFIIRARLEDYEFEVLEETKEAVEQLKAYFSLIGRGNPYTEKMRKG
ncbi:hypothetical protein AUJ10_03725 [Candidatus Pacearchaeota archaeon CG1_02_31_27]|nr:MAG: hypothetical protein AUJ10_03725 [Candidatus Pacearchaeota archaeon CG1_02_31_27]PIN91832.1 MAG: hypothetical protein COU55_03560 [Candidatus Pacearchaeota archaeon CG10_big_fil_rev_8_21_14_0_10_31_59]PIZ80541.1 MAG: hypothetical protein COX99_02620 [Candidatus Pacearchaeota archaeon CG_4_10_14_0_2_um_filter_31_10]